ncbi:MAG: flotillin family protein [Bacteroidales bacterium]|nr:flotillin family protein [Bacteroidales bacterium]
MEMITPLNIVIIMGVIVIVLFCKAAYVKTPPSTALIISGVTKNPRTLIGKGGWRIPFFDRTDQVYLGQITVDIKTSVPVPTKDFINVRVDAVSKVRIKSDPDSIRLAAKNFLNMNEKQIQDSLQDSFEGNMREIIGTLELVPLNNDRDSFSDQIQKKAAVDMEKLGIEIISCNIQNVTDEQGLIKDLGADNTWKIKKDAAITKARSEQDIEIAQADAKKKANDARVEAETAIAQRNNDLEIKKADLKQLSDTQKAIADAAYEIQKQEQQRTINTKTVEAQIEQARQEQHLTQERVIIKENELRAEIEKQAAAEKVKTETDAAAAREAKIKEADAELEARKKAAEAQAYEAEQAKLAQIAKADAAIYEQQKRAEAIKLVGQAEAEAIRAKGNAEAEALEKKAKAYKNYNDTIKITEALVDKLPEIAQAVAQPLANISDIHIYGSGAEASNLTSNVPVVTKQVFDTMRQATGVDMADVLRSGTIQARTDRNVRVEGGEGILDAITGKE